MFEKPKEKPLSKIVNYKNLFQGKPIATKKIKLQNLKDLNLIPKSW